MFTGGALHRSYLNAHFINHDQNLVIDGLLILVTAPDKRYIHGGQSMNSFKSPKLLTMFCKGKEVMNEDQWDQPCHSLALRVIPIQLCSWLRQ